MPAKSKKNYIVQFGSGKPGEMGTGNTELEVFDRIGVKNPKIGFAPFHHIFHGQVNDWSLFQDLVQPTTSKKIELFEFHKEKNMESLQKRISTCDIFVLGSGVCEPYLEFLFSNRLNDFFMNYLREGKHLIGYSAGSISLTPRYIHVAFFREVLLHWTMLLKASETQQKDFKDAILQECSPETRESLNNVFKLKEPSKIISHPLASREFQAISLKALGFIPSMVMLPHFNEAIHATEEHLKAAVRRYPRYRHFGVPNGAAIFHTFQESKLMLTEVVGSNPNPKLLVTEFLKKDSRVYRTGEKIELG
tara:strand:- start:4244 stop:5161 length:918 start_codon:yes stop_codon:yes gene_type:complete